MLWPKTTSFTNAFLVEALVDIIKEKNVFPPEKFGMRYMDYFLDNYLDIKK